MVDTLPPRLAVPVLVTEPAVSAPPVVRVPALVTAALPNDWLAVPVASVAPAPMVTWLAAVRRLAVGPSASVPPVTFTVPAAAVPFSVVLPASWFSVPPPRLAASVPPPRL